MGITRIAGTLTSDQRMIEKVLKPFFEKVCISDLDLAKLTELYDTGAKQTSFSTANHYIALMSHFWNWCERYKYLPLNSNPCKLIKKKKNQPIDYQLLDMDGYKAFLNALEAGINGASNYTVRAFRAIKVIALTGCRHSEITELKKSDMPWSLKTTPNKNYTNTICMFEVLLMNMMHRKRIFIF